MHRQYFVVICFALLINCSFSKISMKRAKRHLIFYESGSCKLLLTLAIPIKLGLKQSMALGLNLQFQYSEATNITQFEKPYPPIASSSKMKRDTNNSRNILYLLIEYTLNSLGVDGRQCLLQAICDNAMYSSHHNSNGIYGDLMHIILTPTYDKKYKTSIYTDAQKAGEFGVDCALSFPECPKNMNILDLISHVE